MFHLKRNWQHWRKRRANAKIGLWAYPSPIPPWEFNVRAAPAEREQRSPLGKPGMIRQRLKDMLSGQEEGQTGRDD